jgi:cytidylate kinase
MPVITIRGQLGSGAPEIGRQVADRLHIDYVDREIIAQVAAKLHRREQDVIAKETPPSNLLGRISEALERSSGFGDGFAGAYLPVWQIPLDDIRYFEALESVVRNLVQNQSLVIRGRGSQFILRDHPGTLHILVVAPMEVRVKRVMEDLKVDEENANLEIARHDNSRREFIKRYFKAELENPVHYDLVVNTGRFSFESGASIIIDAVSVRDKAASK